MMGNKRILGLHLVFLSVLLAGTEYTCIGAQNSTRSCHEQERQALLEFKHSVKDECGMLSSWVGTDCCSWKGVRCNGATGSVVCLNLKGNGNWDIIEDNLREDYYLVGDTTDTHYYLVGDTVITNLSELRHLKHLDLSGNYFQGSQIPEFVGSFKQLSYLNLSNAGFSGIIPHHIGNLSNLKVLDLGSNYYFTQRLIANDVAWIYGLSSLDHLDLSYVDLSQAKNIDMVFHLIPSLTHLSLSGCGLSNVDLGLHLNSSKILPTIQHLDLGFNYFEGQLPHFFQNMTSLTFLDLSLYKFSLAWNSLKLLNMFPSLSELHLSHCGLQNAHFSPTYHNFSAQPSIKYLDLRDNSIGGKFPSELMNITSLRVLLLSSNILNSSIPVMPNLLKLDVSENNFEHIELVGIRRQCHLKELSLSGNCFVEEMIGSPSTNISECSQYALEMLDSDFGYLNCSVPESVGKLTNLRVLQLLGYNLIGSIPESLGRLTNLRFLQLEGINLTVSSPEALGRLTSLRFLKLGGISLIDPIPESLGKLTNLRILLLSEIGSIPESLGSLTNLRVLDLQHNNLRGSIPESLGRLTNLIFLLLNENSLTGSIPESLGRLPDLRVLHLNDNNLTGSIPESLRSLTSLRVLDLQHNSLRGSIPKSLGRLTNLRFLWLNENSLTGSIPASLESLTNLRELQFNYNYLTGSISEALGRLRSLKELDLSYNDLTGSIPESFGRLTCLNLLSLQSNWLTGPIPTSIGRLDSLNIFLVNSNLLTSLPVSIGHLSKLINLDVSDNSLEGMVSEAHFANLSMLEILNASFNYKLIFNFSHEWMPPFQLRTIFLNSCNITNGFPRWLQTQKRLERLVLSNASIYGVLPTWLRKMSTLYELDLSHNKISGSLISLPHTTSLLLHDNLFSGSLPRSLCKRTRLNFLDVSSNRLSGNIPKCVENLHDLMILILSSNRLSGVLPSSLGNNSLSLLWLKLDDNNFNGELPPELGNLRYLQVLDLGNNEFTGSIPKWIGENFAYLMVLRFYNNFTGGIPESLCRCSSLHILDIAHNNLKGSIPRCFGELSGMIEKTNAFLGNRSSDAGVTQVMKGSQLGYTTTLDLVINMDLSSNKLTGEIPSELTGLSLLMGLNLSYNHLSGIIPDNIGNMKALNSLDFSDNQLTGTIPQSLADLNFLSYMNLSHNNLSGRIPTGNQLQTLTDPSIYAGNKDLCGDPLPKNCSDHKKPPTITSNKKPYNVWFYLDITCGFATGFWGVIGVLSFKKQWRRKLFMIAEVTMDKVFVMVAVRVSKIKRGNEAK